MKFCKYSCRILQKFMSRYNRIRLAYLLLAY